MSEQKDWSSTGGRSSSMRKSGVALRTEHALSEGKHFFLVQLCQRLSSIAKQYVLIPFVISHLISALSYSLTHLGEVKIWIVPWIL
jgi:hypothetical protein